MKRLTYYIGVIGLTLLFCLVTSWFWVYKKESVWTVVLTLYTVSLILTGIKILSSDDKNLEYGLLTWLGMRLPLGFTEGTRYIPLLFGFGVEKLKIENKNIKIETEVVTRSNPGEDDPKKWLAGAKAKVIVEVDAGVDVDFLAAFVNNGGYSGQAEQLGDPIRNAVSYQCKLRTLDELVTHSEVFAGYIKRQLKGELGDPGENDDLIGTGSKVAGRVSFVAKRAQEIEDAFALSASMVENIKGLDKLYTRVNTLTDKQVANGDKRPREDIFNEIMRRLEIQQAKTQSINISGGKTPSLILDGDRKGRK